MSKMNKKARSDLWVSTALAVLLGMVLYRLLLTGSSPRLHPRICLELERLMSVFSRLMSKWLKSLAEDFGSPTVTTALPLNVQPSAKQSGANPVGMDPAIYQQRPPIDLGNLRLRKLAAALGPAYMRVSGTWANTTYFQNSDDVVPRAAPPGFNGILTRRQWKGVVDFSHAVNAEIVTSFATSPGTRDAAGVWIQRRRIRFSRTPNRLAAASLQPSL